MSRSETLEKNKIFIQLQNMEKDGLLNDLSCTIKLNLLEQEQEKFISSEFKASSKKVMKKFKALSSPYRLQIIDLLKNRAICSCELEYILKLSQPTISHHLKILEDAEIINIERKGKWNTIKLIESPLIYWALEQLKV